MLGHELRNPLAPILTALQLHAAARRRRSTPRARRHRAPGQAPGPAGRRSARRLAHHARQGRARAQAGRAVARVVAQAIEMASPLLEERSHQLSRRRAAGGLRSTATRRAWRRWSRTCSPTRPSTPTRGGRIALARARATATRSCVAVTDNGVGIAGRDAAARCSTCSCRAGAAIDRSEGGLGLGLAIVRSLVALHGGRSRRAATGVGRGSEFDVRLPPRRPRRRAAAARAAARAGLDARRTRACWSSTTTSTPPSCSPSCSTALGHETRVALRRPARRSSGGASFAPDVALLDIGLPVMDGYELARQLRARAARAGAAADRAHRLRPGRRSPPHQRGRLRRPPGQADRHARADVGDQSPVAPARGELLQRREPAMTAR